MFPLLLAVIDAEAVCVVDGVDVGDDEQLLVVIAETGGER